MFFSPSLNEFNRQSLTVSTFATNQHQSSDNLKMEKLYVSQDNLLWIATDNGVRIMDPAKQVFSHHFLSDSAFTNQGLVVTEKSGKFYAGGSARDFLNLYDSNFILKKRLLPNFKGAQSVNKEFPALLNITREDSNHIWLCTEKGICFLDERTGKTRIYSIDAKTNTSTTANFINRMLIDSKGIHWVFPWRNGIWQLQPSTGQFIDVYDGFIREFNIQKKLLIADAVEDHLGNIWMADLDEGLIHYDRQKQSFGKPLEDIFGPKFQLQNVLFEKPFIWLVTNGRVIRINAENKSREIWPMPVAFNKPITGYCSDQFNHIWITTINGLICFDKANKQFKRFSTNDGLLNNNMHGMIISLHDGNLLYAEENYITKFDPRLLLKNELNTLPEITGVYSQNQSMQFRDEPGKQKKIDLQYKNNDLTFRWALPSFSNPLQNQYYCKLDGVDKDWKYVGNKGEAQYASLNPGTYVFEAAAAAGNGLMTRKPDSIMVVISPPLWKQWWFIAAIAGLVIVLLYYLYWLRLNQLLRMERLRSQISSDLHDDIGSTLSSISIISDLAIQEEKSGQLDLIKEIRENSTNLMEKMDDIVWSINPNNDTLENLMLRIKLFAAKLFEARNIEYSIDIKDNISQVKLPMNFRQHIYLILKESINNLVKYSAASHASLEVSFNKPILQVKIHDNGKGFSDKQILEGNGILNMKSRAAMMKAALNIQSQPGEGTTIDFSVKIK
jgi:streptogramin lyase/two-component sensor histidine kinase